MKEVITLFKEQFNNLRIMFRVSKYQSRSDYQSHYLGLAWEFLNPLIQICIYWFVFGIGLKKGNSSGINYLAWMVIGITPWFYMQTVTNQAAKSIYNQVGMVSKMKFPVSVLPSIKIVSNLSSFWTMLAFSVFIGFFVGGVTPSIYWLQWIYYFFAMIMWLVAFSIFNSTISVLVRDYRILLQSIMRMLFYMSGVLFNFQTNAFPAPLVRILELNPFFYVVSGFRDSMLSQSWFWQRPVLTILFWLFVAFFLVVGSHLHYKFRSRFVDLI
ncbi:transport permease protein [Philodulcilactobacillus myokoensis]|uniref:Transport permease protein n=1 Tax=Philodulcilactobacillus myokoensis TaxID=2929573 RepID=A0A9W6B1X7_9LACO|nr:ABC transporter permease [Philodulcilactobacillus myokoensis]GLB46918.1 transport permease protein [Philodulcilactobacillus myokoensis]